MRFVSTRNPQEEVDFEEAVFHGLAPDGGLYVPTSTPDLSKLFRSFSEESSFTQIAAAMTAALLPDLDQPERLAERAFPFAPVISVFPSGSGGMSLLELFHGPSCAFKDFGASFLAAVMEQLLARRGEKVVILTATSGDTGSAVARAFLGKKGIDVVILYPSERVSPLQEKQLTTLGGNVLALEVLGSFDDCQRMVKEAFLEPRLREKLALSSANSINLGRLLPQSFYYVWAWAQRGRSHDLYFSVPSGNFGNLTSGVLAWKWGLPVSGFIAATNRNDVVPEYLRTGLFRPRPSVATYSNAMDVGNPSNFERLESIFEGSREAMHSILHEEVVSDAETVETIARIHRSTGIVLDPHTAVGYLAAERFLADGGARRALRAQESRRGQPDGDRPIEIVTLATAHPGKFLEIVEEATGSRPALPAALAELKDRPKQSLLIESSVSALTKILLERFA